MAVFQFSALSDGQSLAFNPTADVLNFDQTTIAAADLRVTQVGTNIRIDVVGGTQTGKDVTLQNVSPLQLATTNVTFADGSKLLFGDNSTAQNDNLANSLTGTAGGDLLQGFGGADTMNGGLGNDTYIVGTGDVLSDTGGTDTVLSDINWFLDPGFENLTAIGSGPVQLTGTNEANVLTGNSGNNFFNPRGGDDTIQGGGGNDVVALGGGGVANYGTDVIDGGTGFDTLDFGTAKSAIVLDLGAGTLVGGGEAGVGSASLTSIESAIGGAFNDKISGSAAADSLSGGGGNDTLDGRGGNDTLTGGAGVDTFAFSTVPGAFNVGRVTDFASGTDRLSFDNSVFTGLGTAGNFAAGDPRFASAAGLTSGQDASDRLIYNTTTGQLFYDADGNGAGASQLIATFTGSPSIAATDIQVVGTGGGGSGQGTAGNDSLTGTAGNDSIAGLAGNDTINALGGDDTLNGGTGVDVLSGGAGADRFVYAEAGVANADSITDFATSVDTIVLDGSGLFNLGADGRFSINDGRFFTGSTAISAHDADDRIIHNSTTGEIRYDPDGTGPAAAQLLFSLNGRFATSLDFVVMNSRAVDRVGTSSPDLMQGSSGNDSLSGLGGDDTLNGLGGSDRLEGGAGSDQFIFDQTPGTANADTIVDFASGVDQIHLAASAMKNFGSSGAFAAGDPRFHAAAGATGGHDADDRVIYNTSNGQLLYDADGSGAGAAQLVATLQPGAALAATDIVVDGPTTTLRTLVDHGDSANRIDIVIVDDGYTAADIAAGKLDADANSLTNYMFSGSQVTEPFGRYASFFNVHLVAIDSKESGADHPADGVLRDTALDASYGPAGGIERALTINDAKADALVAQALSGTSISPEMRVAMVNDTQFGGFGSNYATYAAGASSAPETAMHEIGHSFAQLGDEYGGDFAGRYTGSDPGFPNVTTDPTGARWAQWLGYDQPGIGVIGAYEGGLGFNTGLFHPSPGSKMKIAFAPFDAVGREQFVLDFYKLVHPLDGHSANAGVQHNVDAFSVDTIDPAVILVDWTVNGTQFVNSGEQISLAALSREGGDFTITARAYDPTDWVRLDRSSLEESVTWRVINDGSRTGGAGADSLFVGSGNDTLDGGAGNDSLRGGAGNDSLTGGSGSDSFLFGEFGTGNADRIADFATGSDQLDLDPLVMTALGASGNLAAGDGRFFAGAGATSGRDADDRIIYNSSTGDLFYDADGNGAGAAQLIATLQPGASLAAPDIVIESGAASSAGGQLIIGTAGNDSLTGTPGDDTLDGGTGIDTMNGGLGNDIYIVTAGDVLSDTGGIDTVVADINWSLADAFENLTATGSAGVSLQGNNGANLLIGNSGNNFFNPRGGDDTVQGGAGNDVVALGGGGVANYGNDVIDGGTGLDTLDFGTAKSAIVLDLGAGTLVGGGEAGVGSASLTSIESAIGGAFNDRLSGSAGANTLIGGAGNDTLDGRGGPDTLTGGLGADSFAFSTVPAASNVGRVTDFVSATDKLSFDNSVFNALGAAGNFAAGDARFVAGAGLTSGQDASDRLVYNTTTGQLFYDADGNGAGASQLVATLQGAPALAATDIVVTGPSGAAIQGTEGNDTLIGGAGNDVIDGRGGNDLISGLGGNDSLVGGSGNDTLDGGAGANTLDGGLGDDTYVTTSSGFQIVDQVVDAGGTDTLIINSSQNGASAFLPDGLENLTFRGTGTAFFGDSELFGNAADNVIRNESLSSGFFMDGRAGNDTLIGSDHQDWIVVSDGNDVVDGGADLDRIVLGSAGVVDFRAGTASTGSGSTTFSNVEVALGSFSADRLVANDSGNELLGSGGNDTILGGAGNDTLSDDFDPRSDQSQPTGDDSISGGAGDDLIFVSKGNDTVQGDAGNDVVAIIPDSFSGSGTGADSIDGGDGVDTLKIFDVMATVDLAAGTFTDVNNASNHATFTSIENVTLQGAGPSLVSGTNEANQLAGAFGDDTLNGRAGNDTLTGDRADFANPGPGGADHFVFDQAPGAANADVITDFHSASDTLDLDASVMAELGGSGRFAAGDARFFAAAGATGGHDADDRIVYDTSTGNLYYDADGNGAGASQLVAALQGVPTLAATDIVVTGQAGPNVIQGTAGDDSLTGTVGNDSIDGLGGNDTIRASDGDDRVDGGAGNDSLDGGIGFDRLIGGDGNDTLVGGVQQLFGPGDPGVDTLDGGVGDDRYVVDNTGDVLSDAGGIDTVVAIDMDFTLGAGFENLTIANDVSEFGFTGIGNELDNVMSFTFAGGRLEGRGGNDTLIDVEHNGGTRGLNGGAGNDTLTGASGSEEFIFDQAPGTANADVITNFNSGGTLHLDAKVMTALGASGRFAAGDVRFFAAAGASSGHDADDRVVFNTTTGQVFYDADGNGAGAGQLIVTLQPGASLAASQIVVDNGSTPGTNITGTAGNDSLTGTDGNDTLDGGAGVDTMNGGLGNDTYIVTAGDVLADTGGIDTVLSDINWFLGAGFENLTATGSGAVQLTGTNEANVLIGNSGNNFFNPRGGDDTIQGGAGNDWVALGGGGVANYGNDVIDGGAGLDTLDFGTAKSAIVLDLGAGTLMGGGEAGVGSASLTSIEQAIGGAFDDRLGGSAGADSLSGGGGNDTLDGRGGNDTLTGGLGADTFVFDTAPGAGNADLVMDFASATDRLSFDNAVFSALGSAGNFAAGDARFAAGAGFTSGRDASDRIVYDTTTGNLYYDADGNGAGAAQLVATFTGHPAVAATDIVVTGQSQPNPIQGTAGNDSLTGTEGRDIISGLAGNDTLNGLGGEDTLDGGAGIDTMNGGLDGDAYIVTAGDVLSDPGGIDTVMADIDWSLADGFENLTATGTAGVSLQGNNGANLLIGNSGNNFFNPRGGDDFIQGEGGNDWVALGGGGVANYGNEVVDGGAGFDTLDFGTAKSAIVLDLGTGTLLGGGEAGVGSASLMSIEQAIGGAFNDRLSGSAGADALIGGGGNDTIDGRGGNDTLTGGAGADAFVFDTTPGAGNVDLVTDFVSATDKVDLENSVFTALGAAGNFAAGDARFAAGAGFTSGRDASDRIVYDTTTGNLYYDADGNGTGAAQLVATIQGHPAVAAADITVI